MNFRRFSKAVAAALLAVGLVTAGVAPADRSHRKQRRRSSQQRHRLGLQVAPAPEHDSESVSSRGLTPGPGSPSRSPSWNRVSTPYSSLSAAT